MPKEWVSCPSDPELRDSMASELGIPRLVAQVLINRGLRTVHAARSFLWGNERHDPFLLAGMGAACDRIGQALQTNEVIGVYGDYDVDGLTGTALLTRALRTLGERSFPASPIVWKKGMAYVPMLCRSLRTWGLGSL